MGPSAHRWRCWLIVAACCGLIWIGISRATRRGQPRSDAPQVGFPAPAFTLTALDGTERLLSDYQGQGVIVNFWATWCPPCRAEMPALQQVAEGYAVQG